MPLSPNTTLGRYEVLSQLGAGGMGEVYLAHDTQLKRKVALKVLPADLVNNNERLRRFEQEARAASALNHPNIITIHEIGSDGGTHFIATELIEGETLRRNLQTSRFKISETINIAIQITSALEAAHRSGIVHRDIKPENVMLRADGIVKVLDFGLAKLTEKRDETPVDTQALTRALIQTNPGVVMGTVAYMSPEQARGLETDERTDVWSLGIVIYEMLTGRSPFTGETRADVFVNILQGEPPPIIEHRQDTPAELSRILARTLRKNKDERYQMASELAVDLKKLQKSLEFEAELERARTPEGAKESRVKLVSASGNQSFASDETESVILVSASSHSKPPNNLSESLFHLIGREKEIAETMDLLRRDDVRLLTMTGVGGTGKTTLAKAVAREMLASFADGVFFVDLAAVTNAELVASTIAQPLGVKEAGSKPVLELLRDYLCEREMLLVVDNFEQVMTATPVLTELLAAAPRLKILVTSRTLLNLSMEREYAVSPLAVPSKEHSAVELSEYAAVALFVERARNAKASFALTDDNAPSVAEICARLDGLPLAIELAAARMKILSPPAILAKLENRLQLLTGGARDLPARQQTMRGAIDWSCELLTEDEKRLFRRLAIFAGGFTLDAAEVVCDVSFNVLDGITHLVEQSLVLSKEQADGSTRFRMLEVVREYALEALERGNEAEAMQRSHVAYFLSLGEEAEPHLQAAQTVEWLNRLEVENENLRAAFRWLLEHDAGNAARLAVSMRNFWLRRSHLTEARKAFKAALERGSDDVSAAVRFELQRGLGWLAVSQGDYETARTIYEEGLAAGRAARDMRQIALSWNGLGGVAKRQGEFTAARTYYEEALSTSRESMDKYRIAVSLISLGDLELTECNSIPARLLFEEGLATFRHLGDKQAVSDCLCNLGVVAYNEGDYNAARAHFAESITAAQMMGNKITVSYSIDGFAALAAKRGDAECAARLAGAAEHLRASIGYNTDLAERRLRDTYVTKLHAALNEAAFLEAYEQGRKLTVDEAIALALETD